MKPLSYYLSEPIDSSFLHHLDQSSCDEKIAIITLLALVLRTDTSGANSVTLLEPFTKSSLTDFIARSNAYDILQLLAALSMCLLDEIDEQGHNEK